MGELFPKLRGLGLRFGATTWFACFAFALGLIGCDNGQWSQTEFKAAQIQFSVPTSWNIEIRPSGGKAMGAAGLNSDFPSGAVLTALPFLEDAALVVVATKKPIEPQWFAEKAGEYIPLDKVEFTRKAEPYRQNGVSGFEGEGSGIIPKSGVPVYFRTLTVAVNGHAVMLTLYAENARKDAFIPVFNEILASLKPSSGASFGAPAAAKPEAAKPEATKPTEAKPEPTPTTKEVDAGTEAEVDAAVVETDAAAAEPDAVEETDANAEGAGDKVDNTEAAAPKAEEAAEEEPKPAVAPEGKPKTDAKKDSPNATEQAKPEATPEKKAAATEKKAAATEKKAATPPTKTPESDAKPVEDAAKGKEAAPKKPDVAPADAKKAEPKAAASPEEKKTPAPAVEKPAPAPTSAPAQ